MKSFFTKLGGLLLCGVMFIAVGCHDYAEDIQQTNDRIDAIDKILNGSSEGVATDLAKLQATVATLQQEAATSAELEKAISDLQAALQGEINTALATAQELINQINAELAKKASKEELAALETNLSAEITKLAQAMAEAKTEMQNALAALDAKFVAQTAFEAKVEEIYGQIDTEISKVRKELQEASDKIEETLKGLQGEVDGLEDDLADLDKAVETLEGEFDEAVKAIEASIAEVEGSVETLDARVDALDTELATAKADIAKNTKAIEDLKAELKAELDQIKADLAKKADNDYVAGLEDRIDDLEAEISALEAELAEKTGKNADDIKALQDDLAAAKAELAEANAELRLAIAELDTYVDQKVAEFTGEIETLYSVIAALEEEMAKKATKEELAALKSQLEAAEGALKKSIDNLASLVDDQLKTLEAQDNILKGYIEELNEKKADKVEVEAVKAMLAKVQEELALKADKTYVDEQVARFEAQVARIDDAIAEINTVLDGKADKTELAAAEERAAAALAAVKAGLEASLADLEAEIYEALALKADQAYVEAQVARFEAEVARIDAALADMLAEIAKKANAAEVAAEVARLEGEIAALQGELDALEASAASKEELAAAKAELEGKIAAAKTELEGKIADAEAALEAYVDEAVAGLATKLDKEIYGLNKAIKNLDDKIFALDKRVQGMYKDLKDAIVSVEKKLKTEIARVYNEMLAGFDQLKGAMEQINDRVVVTESQIEQLFARIQSVVYKPTHRDHNARVEYATAGGKMILEGNSKITYKVYPANCAETIVRAYNDGKLSLTFDAIDVKSATPEMTVVTAELGENEGDIVLAYKANFGESFYNGKSSVSSALVLAFDGENPQNFSTEYTNFVPAEAARDFRMVLYVNDKPYEKNNPEYNIVWPYVKTGKDYKMMLEGLNLRFTDGKVDLTPAQLSDLGYNAEYKKSSSMSFPNKGDRAFTWITDEDQNVLISPTDKTSREYIGLEAEVLYSYEWCGMIASAASKAYFDKFDYTLKMNLNGSDNKQYFIEYTDLETNVDVLGEDVELYFAKEDGKILTVEEMASLYPAVEIVSTYTLDGYSSLFNIVPNTESYAYPVNVSLKNVDKQNVDKYVKVKYAFSSPLLSDDVLPCSGFVWIDPVHYDYSLEEQTTTWNYAAHAEGDANGTYVTTFENVAVTAPAETGVTKFSEIWAAPNTVEYLLDGQPTDLVEIKPVAGDDTKATVVLTGFEWKKTYNFEARVKVRNSAEADAVVSSVIVVKFTINTVDRNREPVTFIAETLQITFDKNIETDAVNAEPISFASVYDSLLVKGNIDAAANAQATYFEGAVFQNCTLEWAGQSETNTTESWISSIKTNEELLVANKYNVGYKANNATLSVNGVLVKEFTYTKTFKTWYGQEVTLVQPIKLVDPKFDFAPVYQYSKYDEAKKVYYTEVQPNYTFDGDDLTKFTVQQVRLNSVFDVVDAEGNVLGNYEMNTYGLHRTYEMYALEGSNMDGIVFNPAYTDNSYIMYEGKADAVIVNGFLYIETPAGKYEIDNTIFTGDYKTFEVRKFDPLRDLTIKEGKAQQSIKIDENLKYQFKVADNFSMLDKVDQVGRPANDVLVGSYDKDGNFVGNMDAIYGLEYTYTIDMVTPDYVPTGIYVDAETGTITIDNEGEVNFLNPVVMNVTMTATYPQGEKTSEVVTYTFLPRN